MHLTNATPNLVRQHKFSIISRLKVFVLQDHMVVSCIDFLLMLVFFFYHIHEGFICSLHTSPLHPSAGFLQPLCLASGIHCGMALALRPTRPQ